VRLTATPGAQVILDRRVLTAVQLREVATRPSAVVGLRPSFGFGQASVSLGAAIVLSAFLLGSGVFAVSGFSTPVGQTALSWFGSNSGVMFTAPVTGALLLV